MLKRIRAAYDPKSEFTDKKLHAKSKTDLNAASQNNEAAQNQNNEPPAKSFRKDFQSGAYYDALTVVRTSNDIEHWLKFFLAGVGETADYGKLTFEKIVALRQRSEQKIIALGKRAKIGQELLKHLYSQPIITPSK